MEIDYRGIEETTLWFYPVREYLHVSDLKLCVSVLGFITATKSLQS